MSLNKEVAFRDHLVDSIALHAAALLKHGWIDQAGHDTILKLLPSVTRSPQEKQEKQPPTQQPQLPPQPQRAPPTVPKRYSLASQSNSHGQDYHNPTPPSQASDPSRLSSSVSTSSVSSAGHVPTAAAGGPPPIPPSPAARKSVGTSTYRIAVKDYSSKEDGDLQFVTGDVIEILGEVDENWLSGSLKGKIGIFPKKFTEIKPNHTAPQGPPPHISPVPISSSGPSSSQRNSLTTSQASIGPPTRPPPLVPKPRPTSTISKEPSQVLHQIRSKYNGNLFGADAKSLKSLLGSGGETSLGVPITVLAPGEISSSSGSMVVLTFSCDAESGIVSPVIVGEPGSEPVPLELRLKEAKCGGGILLTRRGGGATAGGAPVNVPVGGVRLPMPGRASTTASTVGVGAWKVMPDGNMVSDRGNWHAVEDMGRLMVWDSPLEDQEWEVVATDDH
ncbi:hypothetical protein HDU67_003437 [Dinochytrium kinnereticum]|nr:hypothetical protein HDU67_003437 [Dinochytrium kinnereticum]